ncbi:MAG: DUF2911 domain-containing protein [Longimicrobiales bacterium]
MTVRDRARTPALAATLGLTAALAAWTPLEAQIRGSERAMIRQQADGTTLTIDYGRPHIRGREPVFGGLIEWGHVWTPGANWATSLAVDNDTSGSGGAPWPSRSGSRSRPAAP